MSTKTRIKAQIIICSFQLEQGKSNPFGPLSYTETLQGLTSYLRLKPEDPGHSPFLEYSEVITDSFWHYEIQNQVYKLYIYRSKSRDCARCLHWKLENSIILTIESGAVGKRWIDYFNPQLQRSRILQQLEYIIPKTTLNKDIILIPDEEEEEEEDEEEETLKLIEKDEICAIKNPNINKTKKEFEQFCEQHLLDFKRFLKENDFYWLKKKFLKVFFSLTCTPLSAERKILSKINHASIEDQM
ncbi:MAG: hypothetical protein EOP00_24330 [Pedobacter sp.]|nr:MAG: hypothetical protein EOP00_24330 [Pedobacter sp.]